MQFVRKSKFAAEPDIAKRIALLKDELSIELSEGGISLYRVDDATTDLVGALFSADREKPNGFPHFVVSEDLFGAHGVKCSFVADDSLPFAFMRLRHYEISAIQDIDGFAAQVALTPSVLVRGTIKRRAQEERRKPTVTAPDEWAHAGAWTNPSNEE
jgi:hypothetical protein